MESQQETFNLCTRLQCLYYFRHKIGQPPHTWGVQKQSSLNCVDNSPIGRQVVRFLTSTYIENRKEQTCMFILFEAMIVGNCSVPCRSLVERESLILMRCWDQVPEGSVVDPDPVGSGTFCRIRIRIRNKSFRIPIRPIRIRNEFDT